MKKILFLTAFPPNTKTAGQNFSKRLIEMLSLDYEIEILAFEYPGHNIEIGNINNVKVKILKITRFEKVINNVLHFFLHPLFTGRFNLIRLIHFFIYSKKFDLVYFDFSQVFLYSLVVPDRQKIFMVHDVIYQKYSRKRKISGKLLTLLAFFTENICVNQSNAKILTFSKKDSELLMLKYKVDSSPVNFFLDDFIHNLQYDKVVLNSTFCFYGAWARSENSEGLKWFFDNVYTDIDFPLTIKIIGSGLDKSLRNYLEKKSNVKILGFVANPYEVIANCNGLIAPVFQGAGVKVKVVESLACGTPVLGTEIAFEGISSDYKEFMHCVSLKVDYLKGLRLLTQLTIEEKKRCRSLFLEKYTNNSIADYIKSIL